MEGRPNFPLLLALFLLSAAAVPLSWIGWHGHVPVSDATYLAVKSVEGNAAYESVGETHPGNLALEAGRFLGLFVEPIAFLVLFISLSRQNLLRVWASFKRHHIIVVGESAFADKLSESHGTPIVHLRGIEDEVHQKGPLIRLPFGGFNANDLHAAGARNATRIVIACEDDGQSIDLATAIHRLFPKSQVNVRIKDVWLADQIHNAAGAERLYAFSEYGLAARYAVRSWPPYLIAGDNGLTAIHLLLMGEHDAIEALLSETLIAAKTLTFGRAIFSIVCLQPEMFRARLLSRYPEIEAEAELHFHKIQHLDGHEVVFTDIETLEEPAPVTAAYCLYAEGAKSLASALGFTQRVRDYPSFKAPIFVLHGAEGMSRPAAGARLAPLRLIPFGSMEDLAKASGVLSIGVEFAERAYHEAYLTFSDVTGDAAAPWESLKEEYRLSNRRAVAHIPAKLFDAGIDIREWMEGADIWTSLPHLPAGTTFAEDDPKRERLAKLEHERWIADRRLSGWRFGETRDNLRKIHPDIRPFDELKPEIQAYDRALVDVIGKMLVK